MIVWDRGSWTPVGDPHRGLAKGHLEFELHGDKLAGRWHLIRMAGKRREKRVMDRQRPADYQRASSCHLIFTSTGMPGLR